MQHAHTCLSEVAHSHTTAYRGRNITGFAKPAVPYVTSVQSAYETAVAGPLWPAQRTSWTTCTLVRYSTRHLCKHPFRYSTNMQSFHLFVC